MSGYNDLYNYDSCYIGNQNTINDGSSQYYLNHKAVMPPQVAHAPLLSRGSTADFWGPASTSVIHKDSYLTGRGQPLSKCPSTEVRFLPDVLFPSASTATPSCYKSSLEPIFDSQPRSCQSVTEVDLSAYHMFPGRFQPKFVSINDVAASFLPTRMAVLQDSTPCNSGPRTSYGSYEGNFSYI
jgi:hypothetical protein